jgi:hypothetical protein
MKPALKIKTLILDRASASAVVRSFANDVATVSINGAEQNVASDFPVAAGDIVTLRGGRIVSKRTGGDGGAQKVYRV